METAGRYGYQLPKAMFEFAFEGALLAFIVNGDRFELLALLPRRKPRTDRTVQPPCLNLTSSRLLRFACPIWRLAWISVSSGLGRPSTLIGRKAAGGLLTLRRRARQKPRVFAFVRAVARRFSISLAAADAHTGAEGDVRGRVRGRAVSEQRQRGQARDVSVGTAEETTNRLLPCRSSTAC